MSTMNVLVSSFPVLYTYVIIYVLVICSFIYMCVYIHIFYYYYYIFTGISEDFLGLVMSLHEGYPKNRGKIESRDKLIWVKIMKSKYHFFHNVYFVWMFQNHITCMDFKHFCATLNLSFNSVPLHKHFKVGKLYLLSDLLYNI